MYVENKKEKIYIKNTGYHVQSAAYRSGIAHELKIKDKTKLVFRSGNLYETRLIPVRKY